MLRCEFQHAGIAENGTFIPVLFQLLPQMFRMLKALSAETVEVMQTY